MQMFLKYMTFKMYSSRISSFFEEVIRYLSLRFVLAPAAYVLPRKWVMELANALALLLVILPKPGFETYWNMRRAFGKSRLDSFNLAWGWLSRGYLDFIIHKRIIYKREDLFNWRIIEKNIENIEVLRKCGESYIVASGHLRQGLHFGLYSPAVTYGHAIRLSYPVRERSWKFEDLRIRYQFGTHLKACLSFDKRDLEVVFIESKLGAAVQIYKRLRERGNVVFINIDAWQHSKSNYYERPFAGLKNRAFATGTAQLARTAQCSVISCMYTCKCDGTIVLDWGTPIRCSGNEVADDINVMDKLIDALEVAIGENPTQYTFEIGNQRSWNSQNKSWEDIAE
jgi:lauroyl/myristoyl acyltransferase